ncbi:MAG: two-component regulator propeller domain-containing protein [bacterium]
MRQLGSNRHFWESLRIALLPVIVVVALASSAPQWAQAQKLEFRQLTPDNGLASAQVQTIVQDSRGFMWLGTPKGLNRYDGHEFADYRHRASDSTSIGDSRVDVAYEDAAKQLWFGTLAGLSRYDWTREAFTNYEIIPGTPVLVRAIIEAHGTLWLGTERGLFTFDRARGKATPYRADRFGQLDVMSLYEDRRHHLWIGSLSDGARELDPASGAVHEWNQSADGLRGQDVRAFVDDGAGSIWIGTLRSGLLLLDRATGKITHFRHDAGDPTSLSIDAVHALLPDGAHALWVGTENGGLDHFDFNTHRFHHNKFEPNDAASLSSSSIWSLARDRSGLLWVGTYSGGVNIARQNSAAIRRYRSMAGDPNSLSSNAVMRFWEDARGTMWVATDGGGLNRFDPATGQFVRYSTASSNLNSDAVLAITEDRRGAIWIGTWAGGISRLDPQTGKFTAYTTKNSDIGDDGVFAVHMDRAGTLWIGTHTRGLLRFDSTRGTFTAMHVAEGMESVIRQIVETSDGMMFFATPLRGLISFDPRTGASRAYRAGKGGILSDHVLALLETEPGVLWIGTEAGLDRLDRRSGAIQHFTEADGLPSGGVSALTVDAAQRLWIGGDHGITRFDPAARKSKSYTVDDGLQGSEFNAGASLRTRDGMLYFGGTHGFNVIQPEKITENSNPPPVVLTGFELFNKPVVVGAPESPLHSSITTSRSLTMAHDQSVFTLEFAALDFVAPDKNQYAYKLDGLDADWNEVGSKRSASYTNLHAGHYVFHVKASNNDGVWNERGTSIDITVIPPFWATWWFRTLLAVMTIGIIAYIVRSAQLRQRGLQAMNEQLGRAAEHDRESQQYLEHNVLDILGAMERFSGGDYSVALAVESEDAIGRLRGGFNSAVADRKRAEEELRQSQKMEAVGRLAGGVAHDFNNLLTVIKGNAELAIADLASPEAVREELEEIERAAERASSLTRQLLAFSRKQILKPQTLSLNDMMVDLGRMLRRTVGEDVTLTLELDPALGAARADPGQIEQVVLNLVVNARDAMPRGGELVITTTNASVADVAAIAEADAIPYVVLIVTDTGTGMEPGVVDRVFEPFFTTKEQGKGTGLGLSTVYGSVKQSGGFVLVESALGTGSTFRVYLPRVAALGDALVAGEDEVGPRGSATVLLVEDEDAVRRLASRVLGRFGYTVLTADCGAEALEVSAGFEGTIDLLLTDIVMPGMSGRKLAEQLMPLRPGMRLLYASGYTEDAIIRHGVLSEETAFLSKPFTPNELLRKVQETLQGGAKQMTALALVG